MKVYKTIICACFMLSINLSNLNHLAAKESIKNEDVQYKFPEDEIRAQLAKSSIPEEKWEKIIGSLRQKAQNLMDESGLIEAISAQKNKTQRALKRAQARVSRAVEKSIDQCKEVLPEVEQKLNEAGQNLSSKLKVKKQEIQESKELHKIKRNVRKTEQLVHDWIMSYLEEEMEEHSAE